jgi:hypothetical protein
VDYKNIAGKGEYRENIDILLYRWRRGRVRRAKCMALRPKYRPLHTLGIYLRFWKVFCKILSIGKRTFFPTELDKVGFILFPTRLLTSEDECKWF